MKVVAHTGLVPVKALRAGGNYAAGQVFGLLPKQALAGIASGEVALANIPAGIDTIDVALSVPAAPKPPAEKTGELFEVAEIPADWETMHHLKRMALARQLSGREKLEPPDGMKPLEYADSIIRKEVEARAVAAGGDETEPPAETEPNPAPNGGGDTNQTQTEPPPAPSAEGGGGGAPPSTA